MALRFAANLSMLYTEHDFLQRFAAAAQDGFKGVEFLFPYDHSADTIAQLLKAHGLQQVLFNAPPGDWAAGERGTACLAGREKEFRAGILLALEYAQTLNCPCIHVMAGIPAVVASLAGVRQTYLDNLTWATKKAEQAGKTLLIEPINTRDMPGYHLNFQTDAHSIVQAINSPNLKVQMDLYHLQIMEGDLLKKLQHYLPTGRVAHLQIAGVPSRHEPDSGEVNYDFLFSELAQLTKEGQWNGWIGCEYRPKNGTSAGLNWFKQLLSSGLAS
jgi:2-dehydrotetronate isomerase